MPKMSVVTIGGRIIVTVSCQPRFPGAYALACVEKKQIAIEQLNCCVTKIGRNRRPPPTKVLGTVAYASCPGRQTSQAGMYTVCTAQVLRASRPSQKDSIFSNG